MMKFFKHLLCSAISVASLTFPAAAFEIETHETPDGHEFTFVSMPRATQTVMRFVWKGGDGFLPHGKENVEELGPAMMARGGAGGISPDELATQVDALGSYLQVYLEPDAFHGLLIASAGKLTDTAAIMHTVLAEPTFDPRWLKRFQRNYIENVSADMETPVGQAWRTMREITVGDHPLRQVWNATPVENISSITIEDIKDWHRRTVTSDGVRIFVAGNAAIDEMASAVDIVLRGLPEGSGRQDFPPLTVHYPGKTILVHRPDTQKSYILVGGPIPEIYAPDQEAREIGMGVLGVSEQSRLFTAVRKDLRAAYGFSAWMSDFSRDNAMLYFQGEVETAKLQEAFNAVRDTYETFRTGGVGPVEFPFAKRIYKNRAIGIAEKPRGAADLLVEAWLTDRPLTHGLAYPKRAADLSRTSVNDVIKRDFPPFAGMVKIIVSPERSGIEVDCIISDFSEAGNCL